jgi:murein DD-endopeptidase MepM/ murein hydrolase activator NlpD
MAFVLSLLAAALVLGDGMAGVPPAAGAPAGDRPQPRGGYRWPLEGTPSVARAFDPPDTPYGRGHRGVDLASTPGAAVRAAGPGVVAFAGLIGGRVVVSVQHPDGLRTTYEPVTAKVRRGQPVAAGALLGVLAAGHPGCSAAACLHWGLRRGKVYLDPLSLLGLGRVRLLPLSGAPPAAAGRPVRVTRRR